MAVDGSSHSSLALDWALLHLLDPARDVLHLLCVALPTAFPVISMRIGSGRDEALRKDGAIGSIVGSCI